MLLIFLTFYIPLWGFNRSSDTSNLFSATEATKHRGIGRSQSSSQDENDLKRFFTAFPEQSARNNFILEAIERPAFPFI
jgi:hypothetical protein